MQQINILAEGPASFGTWDLILFCVSIVTVIGLGIWKGTKSDKNAEKKETSVSDYFLAGRGLTWWLVGFSLIAANISTEQFVGMSGKAADWLGMAIASYEWMAAITLVVVAFFFLPKLLRGGVYTIPEFLEYRYNTTSRSIMAVATLLILVGVPTATVIYSGAKVISVYFAGYTLFGLDFGNEFVGCCIIALSGAIYVYVGGLKACAWTDLVWGAALVVGGGVVLYLAMEAMSSADPQHLWESRVVTSTASAQDIANTSSAWSRFWMLNGGDAAAGANGVGGKLHMIRPDVDPEIPWTALVLGLWIPNFFYWGLNQYIVQRTLASKSLKEGQFGIIFAAFLKLIIPFVVVIPGILAYNLFSSDLRAEAIKKNDGNGMQMILNPNASGYDAKKLEATAKTVYPITPEFISVEYDNASTVIAHNIKVAYANDQVKAANITTKVTTALNSVKADAADTATNRTERLKLADVVAEINDSIVKDVKDSKTITTGTKFVGYDYDSAFPTLLSKLLKPGTSWFVLAALFGAVVSSLASMLNSASTIFTMDIYNKLRKNASAKELVSVGKWGVLICVGIALFISDYLGDPRFGGIFSFVQEFQGFISPGALSVFIFGFFVHKCPRYFGWLGILLNVVLYAYLMAFCPEIAFLNRMAICFGTIVFIGVIATIYNIAKGGEAIILPENNQVDLSTSRLAKFCGIGVVIATLVLYAVFW